jgi:NADH-quinone oxidoreductase subunit N
MFGRDVFINFSYDFFIMYIALELQSLSLYILASLKRYSNLSVEAGLKYFIYGSFASGILSYGISLIHGSLGVTDFTNIYILLYFIIMIIFFYL